MKTEQLYEVSPVVQGDKVVDVSISMAGRTFQVMGRFRHRFFQNLRDLLQKNPDALPVLLGSGSQECLEYMLDICPGALAVVDKEEEICRFSGADRLSGKDRVLFLNCPSQEEVLSRLTAWQTEYEGKPFLPIVIPSYLRIDQDFYKTISDSLKASKKYDFWARTRYPRFKEEKPRLLLITTNYFLMGEIIAACTRLQIPHHFLNLQNQEIGREDFVRDFLQAVLEFKPDFVFTINHLGMDREGILADLLARMQLPLASWFVDNPHLILYLYENLKSPYCAIFTWDSDNIQSLKAKGFEKVFYLPLATDSQRFSPGKKLSGFPYGCRDVSFVGNSMVHKVRARLAKVEAADKSGVLAAEYKKVAREFAESDHHLVSALLKDRFPEVDTHFQGLPGIESQLDFETLVTWEATRIYRKGCVKGIMSFNPFIAGDDGWKQTLRPGGWDYHPELNYYADLPGFYPFAKVNFNTTSAQMKGAVNQRVFDVPACGAFLITDYRKQLEDLLEPDREVVYYTDPQEVGPMVDYFLKHPQERTRIAGNARKRILREHTYDHRIMQLCQQMKKVYG